MPSKTPSIDKAAAKRFYLVRKFLKLNQEGMAELCEISQSMVSLIEKGEREIPQSVFKILFLKRNINPAYIIVGGVELEYRKVEKGLMTNVRDLKAEIEIMKADIKLLYYRTGVHN